MHTDENKMNFLRHILNTMPTLTVRQAFDLLDAATESFPTDTPAQRTDGTWFRGVFFSNKAESLMEDNQRVQAIKEVRIDNMSPIGTDSNSYGFFGLKQAKDAVDDRMEWMGYPYRNRH